MVTKVCAQANVTIAFGIITLLNLTKGCARRDIGSFDKDQSTINCKLFEEDGIDQLNNYSVFES